MHGLFDTVYYTGLFFWKLVFGTTKEKQFIIKSLEEEWKNLD